MSNSLCPLCECHVWTHAPGESYVVYNGANYHPACLEAELPNYSHYVRESGQAREDLTACSTREESASQREDKEDAMTKQIQDRMDFQISCNKVLSLESPERFNKLGVFGVLTPAEMEQADAFCLAGGTGTEFGNLLAARDRLARSEYTCIGGCGTKMLGPFRCPDCFAKWVLSAPKNQKRVSA